MRVTVIKCFPYSANGLANDVLQPGEHEIHDHLVSGLIADGYVDGEGHEQVALTANRRLAIIDRIMRVSRAQMEAATDEDLLGAAKHIDKMEADAEASAEESRAEAARIAAAAVPAEPSPISDDDLLEAATDAELKIMFKDKVGRNPNASMKRAAIIAALKA